METPTRAFRAARGMLALGLVALPLLAFTGAATSPAVAASRSDDVIWMRVEVNDQGGEHQKVKINVPLSLIEVVVDSIDKREFMSHLEDEHPSLDIPKLWREIRKMEGSDFITVESDKANVRVWKDSEYFRINVQEEGFSEPNVEVKLPLAIMDYVFETKSRDLNFQDLVDQLRGHLPLTMVTARHEDSTVRIWLEER